MFSPEEAETPVKILSHIRRTISCLQRLESSIVQQEHHHHHQQQQQQQQQPPSVSTTSTQTEKEVHLLRTSKPDVSYYQQSKLGQYQELAGMDGVLRQVVSEVVSSEEVQTSTLSGASVAREPDPLSQLSPPPPLTIPTFASPIVKLSPPQATSPISPSPCTTSKSTTPIVITAACSPRSSDSQITVPQFLIYSTRSLSQSTNVTSFESSDSGLAGESFEAYSPEPPLTIDLGPDVISTPQVQPLPQSLLPAPETASKDQVRRSLKQLVAGNLAATSSTMMQLKVNNKATDSVLARLQQSTSTTFSSTQKRRESIVEELPKHYKRFRASSNEQLKILQLQKSSIAAGVVVTTRGAKVEGERGQSCGGALSAQQGFAWPQVPLPAPPAAASAVPQSLVDGRKGQLRRQETMGDLKEQWPFSPLTSTGTLPQESARSPCRQASCQACGPVFLLEQQLHWQRSSRPNSRSVQEQALVEPALSLLRRASVPSNVAGLLRQGSPPAKSSSQYRRGSSHQLLPGLANFSSQSAAASELRHQIQHHQGLQTHTIYYNSQQYQNQHHLQQCLPSISAHLLGSSPSTVSLPQCTQPTATVTSCSVSSTTAASSHHHHHHHHPSHPLPCIVTGCHQILANQAALAEHLQVKHNQPLYWCCGASYTMSAFLQEHIHRRHLSDPICQFCGRLFQQAKALWEHLSSSQCELLTFGEQAGAGQRYVKCNWIGCNWSGVDQARHHQRVHLRLMNKYTRLDGPLPPPLPPPPFGSIGDAQGTSGI